MNETYDVSGKDEMHAGNKNIGGPLVTLRRRLNAITFEHFVSSCSKICLLNENKKADCLPLAAAADGGPPCKCYSHFKKTFCCYNNIMNGSLYPKRSEYSFFLLFSKLISVLRFTKAVAMRRKDEKLSQDMGGRECSPY